MNPLNDHSGQSQQIIDLINSIHPIVNRQELFDDRLDNESVRIVEEFEKVLVVFLPRLVLKDVFDFSLPKISNSIAENLSKHNEHLFEFFSLDRSVLSIRRFAQEHPHTWTMHPFDLYSILFRLSLEFDNLLIFPRRKNKQRKYFSPVKMICYFSFS